MFHFGKKEHLEPLIEEGVLSFGISESFANQKLTKGQQDNERKRTAQLPAGTKILVGSNPAQMLPLKGVLSVRTSLSIADPYYLKCFALRFCEALFTDFPGNTLVEIHDVEEFKERYKRAFAAQLPDWFTKWGEISYIDYRDLLARNPSQIELMFYKDRGDYSVQGEYRFILIPPKTKALQDLAPRQALVLGSLRDIASITYR